MSKSEYIVWKCETLEQIRNEHPTWTPKQIETYFRKVESILKAKGFFE